MSTLTGARPLATVVIAQDRRNIAPWVMLISVLSTTSIIAYRWIFPDLADRRQLAGALSTNPALELVFGPARDLLTNDGFNAWRAGMLGAFFAGLMAILVVVRNFRADEDSGNAELIASGVITRQARLLVAVLAAVLAALALGVVCTLLTVAFGGQWEPMMLIAATFTCSALVFAGVAAVTCQLGSDAPAASSMAIAVLGPYPAAARPGLQKVLQAGDEALFVAAGAAQAQDRLTHVAHRLLAQVGQVVDLGQGLGGPAQLGRGVQGAQPQVGDGQHLGQRVVHLASEPVTLLQDGTVPFGGQRPSLQGIDPAVYPLDRPEHGLAEADHGQGADDRGGGVQATGPDQREGADEGQRQQQCHPP